MTTVASLIKDILRGLQICRWSLGCNCGFCYRPGFQSWKILKNSWGRDRDDYTWCNDSFIPAVWYHWPSETWCRRPGLAWGRLFGFFFFIFNDKHQEVCILSSEPLCGCTAWKIPADLLCKLAGYLVLSCEEIWLPITSKWWFSLCDGMNELFLAGYEMGALRGAEWLLASGAVEEVPIRLHGKVDQSEM